VETVVAKVTPDETLLADPRGDLAIIEQPVDWLGEGAEFVLDEILRSTLAAAIAEVERLLGPDREHWAWGRLHVFRLAHPLSPLLDKETRARLAVGPAPRGGSGDTVGNTGLPGRHLHANRRGYVPHRGRCRQLGRLAGHEQPRLVGRPRQPHYADLFESWSRGEAFPLHYSRERVEATTERRIRLRPPPDPGRPAG
jgi:penicillin G amidase